MKINSKYKLCIVTPFHKNNLDDYEKLCLESINKVFKNEKKFLVTFKENNLNIKGFENKYFDKHYFQSIQTYNKLCFNLDFYKLFKDFKYILICHLDAIVLHKNNLDELMEEEISYIGAPSGKKNIFDRSRKKLWGIRYFCNGGFSLRKISDFINVLNSNSITKPFNHYVRYECLKSGFIKYFFLLFKTLRQNEFNKAKFFTENFYLHEDSFWTYFAKLFYKDFKLPTLKQTNNFAFDGDPYFFYKKNNYKLPIALHGHYDYPKFLKKIKFDIS